MHLEMNKAAPIETDVVEAFLGKRVLVVTAVQVERDAVLRGIRDSSRFEVLAAGVGPAAAAARTAAALAAGGDYGLVISAGIGGGFDGRAEVGSLAIASEIVAADLGVETPDGFSSLDELGFGASRISVDAALAAMVTAALLAAGLPVHIGPVLTVSMATGTAATALERAARVPNAAAEGMEGFGVAIAAQDCGLPILEIRAISNKVGPRDRSAWRIEDALKRLEEAFLIISEVL
jgi:futalosine hydrolase